MKSAKRHNLQNALVGVMSFALAIFVLLSGCGESPRVLHVYTWADYFKPALVARFEREYDCRIVFDTFDSNETMYAKINAGAGGYDLLTPTSYMAGLMHSQDMLLKLDHALLPNRIHIDPEYLDSAIDKAMDYSVPYMVVNTVIAWLKSRVEDFEPSWSVFDRSDLKGRMTMLNDMRETIGAGLKFLGHSINTKDPAELEAAKGVVIRWKQNIAKYENEQYKTGVASGEFLVVHGYSGDILQVQKENPDVRLAVPREGTVISVDDLVIPRGAGEVRLAHAFIDFLHDPAVAAENTAFLMYLCPNTDAYPLLPEALRTNPAVFLEPGIRARSEMIADLGEAHALYIKAWDEIKAAK
ncbi:MAG: spermidine/putrescine ABC transporter substrate-binding protein [Candidatus Aminicenantes bacterium]|nr:spermidine/putrescine ABC transporter substrate-binding protein [Candidatus Aminicenantes bacterium]